MVHFMEFGIWGLSVNYLVTDNSFSICSGLPQCSLRQGFPKRDRKKGVVFTKHFFSVVILSGDINWLSPVRNRASSVPEDLVERRSEWNISFWSFLWNVWRWFLKYIHYSKEMLPGSWLDWTVCFIFQKPSIGEELLSTETHDICLWKNNLINCPLY